MKILLLNPPNENEIIANDFSLTREHGGHYPPLGIMYIASYIKNNTEDNVSLLDCPAREISYEQLSDIIENGEYDIIGITCLTLCLVDVKKTIDLIRFFSPSSMIICGGPHATIYPKETIELGADKVVVGEGEIGFLKAMESNQEIIQSERIDDLDILPYPLRKHDVCYRSVLSPNIVTSMITTRGCPFQCSFCDRPTMGKHYRERSVEDILGEIEECLSLGINEISMYDDTFTINKNRVFKLCDEIEKRGINFTWDIRARVDTITKPLLARLKDVGCLRIRLGVESGSQKVLDNLKKGITLEQVRNAFKWADEVGMETFSYFMIGNPGETLEEINESFRLSKELGSAFSQFTILTPFPGTPLYRTWIDRNGKDPWLEFAKNPTPNFEPPVWGESFDRKTLNSILKKLYKDYYLRWGFIAKKLKNICSFSELTNNTRIAWKLLTH